jgi:hypothetical protein
MNFRILPIAGIASVAGLLSIAFGGSAIAGGGGFPPTPGTYRTTDTATFADLLGPPSTVCGPKGCGPGPSDEAFVSVDRGLLTFKPKTGPRLIQQNGTMLNLDAFAVDGSSVFGCWIIPDRDFIVSSDLSSASLSTTVPAQSNCPGAPVAISAANGVSGKGGGGGGGGAGMPISLNVSWTYRGVVSHFTDDARQQCGSFETRGHLESSAATATAQGQVSIVTETMTSNFGSIQSSATDQVVRGVPPDACF